MQLMWCVIIAKKERKNLSKRDGSKDNCPKEEENRTATGLILNIFFVQLFFIYFLLLLNNTRSTALREEKNSDLMIRKLVLRRKNEFTIE